MSAELVNPTIDGQPDSYALPFRLNREESGLSSFWITETSTRLDELFGLDSSRPFETSQEARNKIKLAKVFMFATLKTTDVVDFFTEAAIMAGHFLALPADELEDFTDGKLTKIYIDKAIEEGYLTTREVITPENNIVLAELTLEIGRTFEILENLASQNSTSKPDVDSQ